MIEPSGLAAGSDGKNLYVAAHDSNAVVALNRNTTTGVLSQDGTKNACISEDGSNGTTAGTCVDGRALSVPRDLVVSPDDKHVYMVTETSDAVAIFSRNATTGLLTQAAGTTGCISNGGAATCATGRALDLPKGLTITPDGNYIYVGTSTSGSQGLAAFSRDSATGGLTQLAGLSGCITVTGTSGTCTTDALFNGVNGPAVSYDGQNLYVPSTISDVVHTLYIDNATGALSRRSDSSRCVSETGSSGACIDGKGLDGGIEAIVSPDDKDVYVLGYNSDAISVFARAR